MTNCITIKQEKRVDLSEGIQKQDELPIVTYFGVCLVSFMDRYNSVTFCFLNQVLQERI